jgi:bis(5'-nucleosidyl)-tetraphosphatase
VRTLSAGVVVVRFAGGEGPEYLLLRAYRYWDFPKGEVAQGEDPLAAAVREVREETTLADLEFRWGRDYRETAVYGRGKVARYYVAATPGASVRLPPSPELGRPEHHEYRWLGFAAARRLLADRVKPILDWVQALISA